MPARQIKSLTLPELGYRHREHRSKKSIKGENTSYRKAYRVMRIQQQQVRDRKYMQFFINLRAHLTH